MARKKHTSTSPEINQKHEQKETKHNQEQPTQKETTRKAETEKEIKKKSDTNNTNRYRIQS
jgi:hypothetical protein